MGWVKDAMRELRAGRQAVARPTGGPVQGRIDRGQVVTLSPLGPGVRVAADDVVLAAWKGSPLLVLVKQVREGEVLIGDTLGGTFGWVPLDAVAGKVTDVQPLPAGTPRPERKVRMITFGIDTPDDYGPEAVLATLGVPPLDAECSAGQAARVLFMPSFHPEVCVTAYARPVPHVVLATAQANLWYWGCYERQRDNGKWPPDEEPPPQPRRWEGRADVPPDRWAAFASALAATEPLALADTNSQGIDGMSVLGQYRDDAGRAAAFKHWVGGDSPRHAGFVLALHRLADDCLRDERSVRVLESVFNYLHAGLPLKQSDGPPYTLRIFGSLSSSEEADLSAAFGRVPPGVPVLVDLSNFDSMGTLLYSVFRHFLARPGPTVWWASDRARGHLTGIGVNPSFVFSGRDEAVSALAVRGR